MLKAVYKFIKNLRTGAGDGFAGVSAGFHPGEKENERYPAARIGFEL